ncbi:hypothetical protein ACFSUS_08685 [Spirosoma soli]|uniref:DUF4349 domain-containing protein n=1 Tax=Spirosoma soli TaxID=1770529 RepID=A0ABW5M0X9_9BACT
MQTLTNRFFAALLGIATLASCSRPVAYFQRGPVEHYNAPKIEAVAAVATLEQAQPAEVIEPTSAAPALEPTPVQQVAQAKAAMTQIETYVRNDSKLAAHKKLNKRMDRVRNMLNTVATKTLSAPTTSASAKKMNLLERMTAKRIDKQIKNKLSPEKTMAQSRMTIGIIVAAAGLLLLLIGNGFGAVIGGIALLVGVVLIILDLVQ